jgi:hypothetical protein
MSTKDKSQGSNGLTILAEKLQNLVFYDLGISLASQLVRVCLPSDTS